MDLTRFFNDLNTSEYISVISRWIPQLRVPEYNLILRKFIDKAANLLGLLQKDPEDWFKGGTSSGDQAEFDAIALRRQEARAAKDWAAADAARDEAKAKGIVLEDGPDGTTWRKA